MRRRYLPNMPTSSNNPLKLFTFAQSQNLGVLFTLASLKEIEDYSQRVDPGEEVPAGEDPISGAVAHLVSRKLPEVFGDLLSEVEEINTSGDLLLGFGEKLSAKFVIVEIWTMPRNDFDNMKGYLGTLHVPNSKDGIAGALKYLREARATYRPNSEACSI